MEARSYLRLGMSTLAYERFDLVDALKRIRAAGFSEVEICADRTHLDPRVSSIEEVRKAKDVLNRMSLRPHSFHAPWTDVDLASKDDFKRESSLEAMMRSLDCCAELECPIMVLHANSSEGLKYLTRKAMRQITTDSVKTLAEYARDLNVKIALENLHEHGVKRFGSTVSDLKIIIKDVGSDSVGICLDTGHANMIHRKGFSPEMEIGRAGKDLISLHLHDNDGLEDRHWPIGRGTIDWHKVLEVLGRANPDLVLMHEVFGDGDPDKIARECIRNMELLHF